MSRLGAATWRKLAAVTQSAERGFRARDSRQLLCYVW